MRTRKQQPLSSSRGALDLASLPSIALTPDQVASLLQTMQQQETGQADNQEQRATRRSKRVISSSNGAHHASSSAFPPVDAAAAPSIVDTPELEIPSSTSSNIYQPDKQRQGNNVNSQIEDNTMQFTGVARRTCEHCGRAFKRASDCRRHERIHTNTKPHLCPAPNCGKAFVQKSALTTHLRTHTGEKPYTCRVSECGRLFADASSRKKHEATHDKEEKKYACSICPHQAFRRKDTLGLHMKRVHPELTSPLGAPNDGPEEAYSEFDAEATSEYGGTEAGNSASASASGSGMHHFDPYSSTRTMASTDAGMEVDDDVDDERDADAEAEIEGYSEVAYSNFEDGGDATFTLDNQHRHHHHAQLPPFHTQEYEQPSSNPLARSNSAPLAQNADYLPSSSISAAHSRANSAPILNDDLNPQIIADPFAGFALAAPPSLSSASGGAPSSAASSQSSFTSTYEGGLSRNHQRYPHSLSVSSSISSNTGETMDNNNKATASNNLLVRHQLPSAKNRGFVPTSSADDLFALFFSPSTPNTSFTSIDPGNGITKNTSRSAPQHQYTTRRALARDTSFGSPWVPGSVPEVHSKTS